MKRCYAIVIFCMCAANLPAQVDTTLDYKQRFYSAGKIITQNKKTDDQKQGLWIEHFDRKWNPCPAQKSAYYRLVEYKNDVPVGKVYDFYRSGKIQMVGRYIMQDTLLRTGTFIWFAESGKKQSLEYYAYDTLIECSYHKNGNLMRYELRRWGYDEYAFIHRDWYYKNGNPQWLHYEDVDTSYYLSGRKNGTIKFRDILSQCRYERVRHDKKGSLTEKSYRTCKSDTIVTEKYVKGKMVSRTAVLPKKSTNIYPEYPEIIHYEGNHAVVIIEKEGKKEYSVNGQPMSEAQYIEYEKLYNAYIESRRPKHYYKQYSKDSILVYEGLFKEVDLHCGLYDEYHRNGKIKIRGWYDRRGRKTGFWSYYDEEGMLTNTEWYKKGKREW